MSVFPSAKLDGLHFYFFHWFPTGSVTADSDDQNSFFFSHWFTPGSGGSETRRDSIIKYVVVLNNSGDKTPTCDWRLHYTTLKSNFTSACRRYFTLKPPRTRAPTGTGSGSDTGYVHFAPSGNDTPGRKYINYRSYTGRNCARAADLSLALLSFYAFILSPLHPTHEHIFLGKTNVLTVGFPMDRVRRREPKNSYWILIKASIVYE